MGRHAKGECFVGVRHLFAKRDPRLLHLIVPMDRIHKLPKRDGDEHAQNDDTDFADERAPAVYRLWQPYWHAEAPWESLLLPFRRGGQWRLWVETCHSPSRLFAVL